MGGARSSRGRGRRATSGSSRSADGATPSRSGPSREAAQVYRYDWLYRNPSEDTWWLEGREVRPVLREVTTAEAAVLMAEPDFVRIAEESLQALRDFRARSQER